MRFADNASAASMTAARCHERCACTPHAIPRVGIGGLSNAKAALGAAAEMEKQKG